MKRTATFIFLLFAALIFPAVLGGAGEMHDGAPPRLLEWPMLPGESLNHLARLIYPNDTKMQRNFIDAAVRENPATFSGINANHKFDQETLIWLPDLKELSQLASLPQSPRHFLHPALPAMQPSVAGAQPSRLQLSAAIDDKPAPGNIKNTETLDGVRLAPAAAARHLNAMPVYDSDAAVEIETLVARNQALQKEQEALNARIAVLEAGIAEAVKVISARDRRPVPRLIKHVAPPPPDSTSMVADSLLPPSPLHLLTATGILLVGGGLIWLRRRRKLGEVETPVASHQPAVSSQEPVLDLGAPATQIQIEENFTDDLISVDEIASIVEEAKIFVALGRTEHAIEVLEDYIATHPRASAHPWLYLMEIYRNTQHRDNFEAVAKRFHQAMNVIAPQWETSGQAMVVVPCSLEEFPHLLTRLTEGWGTLDAQDFLNNLLQDNRGGERQGFSMEVLQEILLLLAILELRDHLPPVKPF